MGEYISNNTEYYEKGIPAYTGRREPLEGGGWTFRKADGTGLELRRAER